MKYYLLLLLFSLPARGQLTLPDCHRLAEQHYPLAKRYDLISKSAAYTIDNLNKGYLPQFSVNAQASYQSAVTQVPISIPGINIPTMNKDQYKATVQLDQVIYDGGEIATQKALQKSNEQVSRQQLQADLYALKDRINQLYFGILLADEQLQQNELMLADLKLGLKKTQAALDNGTAFRSNADLINAEILSTEQRNIELTSSREAYARMLSLFIGQPVDTLEKPAALTISDSIHRPELLSFDAQQSTLLLQHQLLKVSTRPKVGFYIQGGYGRPGLNMLDNSFQAYYLGGVRLSWSPSAFYTLKKKRAQLLVNEQEIAVQKETFLFNTAVTVQQESAAVNKYQQLMSADEAIIKLRNQVKTAAIAQLENGVITGNDFLKEVNDENLARQNKSLHEMQWLLSQYNQQTTTGNL
ncbi:TolC family protein [Chitinophaga sancti]|uniref:Outer membrane protein TolC n=1 Tax=Chitinophaga sancti TaxID=1004 RepID=A0A1K1S406_9BACT|nr:TolC family protein [Chitinophaga sancti]WQD63754.1 TolC family protein [Chitinophaga sancti]WQG90621.1 TolC family protein [Chitinophaga sancti]SFW79054.1 Outer membrane protein TolC [Chitinophaga sancti]